MWVDSNLLNKDKLAKITVWFIKLNILPVYAFRNCYYAYINLALLSLVVFKDKVFYTQVRCSSVRYTNEEKSGNLRG